MRVIGMISGTSYDAIEALAVELQFDGDTLVADLRAHHSAPYPAALRTAIAEMLPPATTTLEQVCRLDTAIGQHFAQVAAALAQAAFAGGVELIASHGQTVFHWVEGDHALGTLQLGQPAFIAERTGATVVADLRARDITAGGHGAPLASLLDVLMFGAEDDLVRGALNLGGIANVTIVGAGREPLAFDNGPANALLDAVVGWRTEGREPFDADGQRAARGSVDAQLLARLLDEPYYRLAPPKSTGKEIFNLAYVRERLDGRELETDDLLATLTALTAEVVASDLRRFGVGEVIAAGGGTLNPVLMGELARRLPGVSITTTADYGLASTAKEALLMALIGFLTAHGLPATIPSCTGARHASILGSVVPGSSPPLLETSPQLPRRLTIRTPLAAPEGLTA